MKNQFQLHTQTGLATVGSLTEFVRDYLPIQIVETRYVNIPILSSPAKISWGTDTWDSQPSMSVTNKQIQLDRYYEMSREQVISSQSKSIHTASLREHWMRYVTMNAIEELKQLILNRDENFYRPNLGVDEMNRLSYALMNESGGGDVYCFNHSFSKYQNYFVMAHEDAFKNFCTEPHIMHDKDMYKGYSKLAEINPKKWIMGRSDNPHFFREEMGSLRQYSTNFKELEDIAGTNDIYRGRLMEPNPRKSIHGIIKNPFDI